MPQNLVDRFPRNGANEVGTAWPQTISNNGISVHYFRVVAVHVSAPVPYRAGVLTESGSQNGQRREVCFVADSCQLQ